MRKAAIIIDNMASPPLSFNDVIIVRICDVFVKKQALNINK